MRVALVGPIRVATLTPWLTSGGVPDAPLPKGRGGTAVTQLARSLLDRGRELLIVCLLYTSPSPRDGLLSRMPSSA